MRRCQSRASTKGFDLPGGTVVYLIAQATHHSTSRSSSDASSWIEIVLGVVLLLLAVRNWRNRPKPGTEPDMPKWVAVMAVLFLVFGVVLIAKGLQSLT